jgi:hypothetical protein
MREWESEERVSKVDTRDQGGGRGGYPQERVGWWTIGDDAGGSEAVLREGFHRERRHEVTTKREGQADARIFERLFNLDGK